MCSGRSGWSRWAHLLMACVWVVRYVTGVQTGAASPSLHERAHYATLSKPNEIYVVVAPLHTLSMRACLLLFTLPIPRKQSSSQMLAPYLLRPRSSSFLPFAAGASALSSPASSSVPIRSSSCSRLRPHAQSAHL